MPTRGEPFGLVQILFCRMLSVRGAMPGQEPHGNPMPYLVAAFDCFRNDPQITTVGILACYALTRRETICCLGGSLLSRFQSLAEMPCVYLFMIMECCSRTIITHFLGLNFLGQSIIQTTNARQDASSPSGSSFGPVAPTRPAPANFTFFFLNLSSASACRSS